MIKIDLDLNFEILQNYHEPTRLLADLIKSNGNIITEVRQIVYINTDLDKGTFLQKYGELLARHQLKPYAGDLLYLTTKISEDIQTGIESNNDLEEASQTLEFLIELLRMGEKSTKPITIEFSRKSPKGKAILQSPRLVEYITKKLVEVTQKPSFNPILALLLENVTVTRANLTRIYLDIQYRYKDPSNYYLAVTCINILNFLNNETPFKASGNSKMSNDQARFIFDLIYLIKPLPMKHRSDYDIVDFIRLLIRNHANRTKSAF